MHRLRNGLRDLGKCRFVTLTRNHGITPTLPHLTLGSKVSVTATQRICRCGAGRRAGCAHSNPTLLTRSSQSKDPHSNPPLLRRKSSLGPTLNRTQHQRPRLMLIHHQNRHPRDRCGLFIASSLLSMCSIYTNYWTHVCHLRRPFQHHAV